MTDPSTTGVMPAAATASQELLNLTKALDEHAIVAVTDARGRILRVNDKFCAISKYSRDELLGQDHRIINSRHHPPEFFQGLWRTITRGEVWKGEICNRAKDGALYWVDTTIVPFLGPDGRPKEHIAIRADITERKRAEQRQAELMAELKEINQELNQFAYVVSHDLKAPLRAISSLASWLAEDYAEKLGPDGRSQLGLLLGRVKRMDALVDGILRYSRIGREQEEVAAIDVGPLLHEIVEMLGPPAGIRVEIGASMPTVYCERTRLTQVFENLISNAVKYMGRPDGRIWIGWAESPEAWTFHVRDTGPGIDERYFEKIFQIFQTLTARDEAESTGIGLAVVKKNVEVCGGQVWVESKLGEGSTFSFRLPKAPVRTPKAQHA